TYQWRRGNQDLPGQTGPSLQLRGLDAAQTGTYTVLVRNQKGKVESIGYRVDLTSLSAWGENQFGQTAAGGALTNLVAIAAGNFHSLALRRDGTVIGWGGNRFREIDIPANLTNVV